MNIGFSAGNATMPEIWLIIMIAMLVVEVSTVSLTSIWFAGGAAAAFIASILSAPLWLQILIFAAVTIILLLAIRPISVRFFLKNPEKTNVDSLAGKEAVVTENISNTEGHGSATVGGVVWTARMKEPSGSCVKGSICTVDHVEGVKLILTEKEEK